MAINRQSHTTQIAQDKIKAYLAEEEIRTCVNNSISDGLTQICEHALAYETTVRQMAEAYVKNVFPYFERAPGKHTMSQLESEPVPELQSFWKDVSRAGGHEFNQLESYLLSVEGGMPELFLNRMKSALNSIGDGRLTEAYLEPIYTAIRQKKFEYSSIDEMIAK
jgi:hypothetical protein